MSGQSASTPRVIVARTLEEIEVVRDTWLSLQNDRITASVDFYRCVLESEPRAIRPHVLVLERGGQPEAMLVARLETLELPVRLGYKTVYSPTVRSISVVLGGALGVMSEDNAVALVDELRSALRAGEADVVLMRHTPLDSPLYRTAVSRPPRLLRQAVTASNRYWEVDLPPSFEEFTKSLSKKTREGFRRYANRFVREFGDRIAIREDWQPEALDDLVRDVEAVAAKSWQRGLGVGFVDDVRWRARTALALERGWLRALVLYVDGTPIAFWMGDVFQGRFRSLIPGYDPAYAEFRVGNYVLMQLVERLCADEAVSMLDFGYGDVEYKERLASRTWRAGDAMIFAPTFKGVRVNVLRTALISTNETLRKVARSAGLFKRIKRRWRRRLVAKPGVRQNLESGHSDVQQSEPPKAGSQAAR
jgi:CelD/BcsL family acetyltransferase involved in cellulose biosynthesis